MLTLGELLSSRAPDLSAFRLVVSQGAKAFFDEGRPGFVQGATHAYLSTLEQAKARDHLLAVLALRLEEHHRMAMIPPQEGDFSFMEIDLMGHCLSGFGRTELGWSAVERSAVLECVSELTLSLSTVPEFRFAIGLAEQFDRNDEQLQGELARLRGKLDPTHLNAIGNSGDAMSIFRRVLAMSPHDVADEMVDGSLYDSACNYSRCAYDALRIFEGQPGLRIWMGHLLKPTSTSAWAQETASLASRSRLPVEVARALLSALVDAESEPYILSATSQTVLKGAAATLALVGDASDAIVLEHAAIAADVYGVFNQNLPPMRACVAALGEMSDPEGQKALSRLMTTFRTGEPRKRVAAALAAVAARSGLSPGQLLEREVDAAGLDDAGSCEIGSGVGLGAVVSITSVGPSTQWTVDRVPTTKVPVALKAAHSEVVASVRSRTKQLSAVCSTQKARLEGLFAEDRSWSPRDWTACYFAHPVMSAFTRSLLWSAEVAGREQGFLGAEGTPAGSTVIRLWHPLGRPFDEVDAWRDVLLQREVIQPFKQAYRELYVLTPAEAAQTTSARFDGHVVRVDQLFALMKGRGWQAKWVGHFNSGRETTARFVLAEGRFRAGLDVTLVDDGDHDPFVNSARIGHVHFQHATGKSWKDMALSAVPAVVFSEVMRDVDLFVSVSTVANDPYWRERVRRNHPLRRVLESYEEAPLTPVGEIRRDVIARLLPAMKINKKCRLEDRVLRVRGTLGEYTIHLGTGNVMMEPENQYLCVVQGGPNPARSLFLPFEGDALLALIFSKAAMLVSDDTITDESILRQIRVTRK